MSVRQSSGGGLPGEAASRCANKTPEMTLVILRLETRNVLGVKQQDGCCLSQSRSSVQSRPPRWLAVTRVHGQEPRGWITLWLPEATCSENAASRIESQVLAVSCLCGRARMQKFDGFIRPAACQCGVGKPRMAFLLSQRGHLSICLRKHVWRLLAGNSNVL